MTDLQGVEKRIKSVQTVRSVVSTMRALSAVQMRNAASVIEALRSYERQLATTLAWLRSPALTPPPCRSVVTIALGTDQGLCGALPRRVVQCALAHAREQGERGAGLVAVGLRTAELLEARGEATLAAFAAPSSLHGIDGLVESLAGLMLPELERGGWDGIDVVYTRQQSSGSAQPQVVRVYPVAHQALAVPKEALPRLPPHTYAKEHDTVFRLLEEWTYVALYQAAVEAHAAEQAARLRTTDAATHNADNKLDELKLAHNHLRQELVTQELQELTSGFEAG